jgi:hypothetical protein
MLLVIGRKVEASMPLNECGTLRVRTAGQCLGKGWCNASIQMDTRASKVEITPGYGTNDTEWRASPCSYGMVVENSWYRFSPHDLDGDSFLQRNQERGVPVVLDFAIQGVGCPADGETVPKDYACVSENSECADGPILSSGPSHYCTCSMGFHGNPYIARGCQGRQDCPFHLSLDRVGFIALHFIAPILADIDECKRRDLYPCHGRCDNKPGDYDCTCPPGMRGDAKAGPCTDIFPLAAKVTLGNIYYICQTINMLALRQKKKKAINMFVFFKL